MWRVARQVPGKVKTTGRVQRCLLCTKPEGAAPKVTPITPPPPPPPVKKSRGFLKILGGTFLVAGGAIVGSFAYAYVDPEFRKQVESNWPFLVPIIDQVLDDNKNGGEKKDLLKSIKGYLPSMPSLPTKAPAIPFITDTPKEEVKTETKSLMPKPSPTAPPTPKEEPVKEKKTEVKKKEPPPAKKSEPAPVPVKEDKKAKKEREAREAREKEEKAAKELEAKMIELEIEEAAEEAAMQAIIDNMLGTCMGAAQQAIDTQSKAVHAIKVHTEQLKHAMDESGSPSDKPQQWESVSGTLDAKKDATAVAEMDLVTAKEEFQKLKQTLDEAKAVASKCKSKFSKGPSPTVVGAEETLNKLQYDVDNAVAEVQSAMGEFKIMREYHDLVEKGKQQFKKELESIMPEVKLGKRGKKLTEDELNSLIGHAHRRIEQLQKQLAEQQALEQKRISVSLEKQREDDRREAESKISRELQRQAREFSVKQQRMVADVKNDYEQDMRHQLRRQAAAHSDHLQDVLRVQAEELEKENERKEAEIVRYERERSRVELHGSLAKLRGIESAIEERADLEKHSQKAQELWLACESLKRTIAYGNEGAYFDEDKLKPLSSEISAVKEAGETFPVINGLIDAMPEEAIKRGVVTEEILTSRWKHIKKLCKRVAMVDEVGSSLFQYFLSYFQSFLIIDTPPPSDAQIDPSSLDTFKLLAFADYHIRQGDLDQAVRYVNQLQGMPRKVADDWLKEAVLLLETSQVANMLSATASAAGLGALCI